ncbi:hypothetical protein DNTS_014601 [Danionella cerebrum]|uniref:Transmembrane protein 69 n=1 Tax=Danionella cerebrum TaxID=2873325 RepID=A0A553N1A3_9TELE|nr:hypothetical protein DNTS_014601 [Danionella translucida]
METEALQFDGPVLGCINVKGPDDSLSQALELLDNHGPDYQQTPVSRVVTRKNGSKTCVEGQQRSTCLQFFRKSDCLRQQTAQCSTLFTRTIYRQLSPRHDATPLLGAQSFHWSAQRLKKRIKQESEPRDYLSVKDLKNSPKPALYLGILGLVPFVLPPLFMGALEMYLHEVAFAQAAYGACIVSFLGGIRWGFALPDGSPAKPDWFNLANSIIPPLFAWIALLFYQDFTACAITVIIGLGVALHNDLSLLPTYHNWFKVLRIGLTIIAVISMVSTIFIREYFPEKEPVSDK